MISSRNLAVLHRGVVVRDVGTGVVSGFDGVLEFTGFEHIRLDELGGHLTLVDDLLVRLCISDFGSLRTPVLVICDRFDGHQIAMVRPMSEFVPVTMTIS